MVKIGVQKNYYKKELGKFGENTATQYLIDIGYEIIERNVLTSRGELDIVALDDDEYVFVEVKTRKSKKFGEAIEAVDYYKQKHMKLASKYFTYKKGIYDEKIRFDIIEVYVDKRNNFVNHIKNVLF